MERAFRIHSSDQGPAGIVHASGSRAVPEDDTLPQIVGALSAVLRACVVAWRGESTVA